MAGAAIGLLRPFRWKARRAKGWMLMEKKRSLSLMQKMTLWFILIILLPSCALSVVLCRALTDRAYDILVEDHYAVLGIARESISRSAASVESMVEMLSLNAELNKLLTDSKQTPYQRVVKILFDVGDTVAQAQLMLSGLDARVTLFSEDERIPETYWNFLRLKRLDSLPQYERFLLAGETRGWGGIGPVYPTETVLRPAGNPQMLCYYQKLLAGFGECVGVIQCGVSPQKIFSSLQIEGNADVHYYVFQGGEVIYQSDAEQALPEEYRPEESRQIIRRQLYLSRPLESMGLSLVMRLDYGQLHSQALASGLVPFLTAIGSGVLLLVATCTFLWSIQKRLDQAVDFARRAKEGSMEIAFPNPGGDEVGQLIDAFNALLSRLQENSRRMIEHERNEKYAMRLALQYQMNPHFLFNSLNWIQMSTELGVEREQISEAILLLGKLLRNNLQGSAMTTLDEEARCAQDYVRLMNMRKQDLVGLDLQLNELPENLPVMRFLFQPLCENAIQHGMETGRPLHIRIRGWQAGAQVHLVVENDGAMIPLDKLAMLRLQTPSEMDEHGIGLRNLSARLRLLYGADAAMEITSTPEITSIETTFLPRTPEEIQAGTANGKDETACGC